MGKNIFCCNILELALDPNHIIIDDRMENSIYNRKTNSAQSALARREHQGCTGPPSPPLTPLLHRVAAKFFVFVIFLNFHKIFNFVFCKIFPRFSRNSKLFCQNFVFREISMQRGNGTLRWSRIRNRTFTFCHLKFCYPNYINSNPQHCFNMCDFELKRSSENLFLVTDIVMTWVHLFF